MFPKLHSRPSPAMVVALIALFVALGGSSYAAISIGSGNIRNSSIRSEDIGSGQVRSSDILNNDVQGIDIANSAIGTTDVSNHSLLANDFASGQLPAGASGPQGPQGPQGAQGPQGGQGAAGSNGLDGVAPAGAVMFFNLASCPAGWSEFTAGRGRYIVGLPSGGTLGGTSGTPLTNQESRPVGQHNHTINQTAHTHPVPTAVTTDAAGSNNAFLTALKAAPASSNIAASFAIITLDDAGSVAGTNAPYLQLRACEKS